MAAKRGLGSSADESTVVARARASEARRRKRGTLKRGKSGHGGTVKSRKQAITIGLSEARKKGAKLRRKRLIATPRYG